MRSLQPRMTWRVSDGSSVRVFRTILVVSMSPWSIRSRSCTSCRRPPRPVQPLTSPRDHSALPCMHLVSPLPQEGDCRSQCDRPS